MVSIEGFSLLFKNAIYILADKVEPVERERSKLPRRKGRNLQQRRGTGQGGRGSEGAKGAAVRWDGTF